MNRTYTIALLALTAILPAAAIAQDSGFDLSGAYSSASGYNRSSGAQAVPAPVPVPVPAAVNKAAAPQRAAPKDWTIMVYIDGKNSLEQFAYTNIHQMEQVGSNANVNVVVEVGRMNGQYGDYTGDGNWTGCRRFLIKKAANPTAGISSPVLQTMQSCDMGDYHHAIDFGKWAMQHFPARHYMYVLWNHGGGWVPNTPGYTNVKAIAYDDQTKHVMSTPQMGAIMRALGHIDVYGSDACLMQMAEVAYELKDNVDYVVGSEKTEPGNGWDYAALLRRFYASGMSAADLANAVTDTYTPQYSSGATFSTIRTAALPGFAQKLNDFVGAVESANEGQTAAAARDNSQNFEDQGSFTDYKDLYDFLSLMASTSKNADVKAKAQDLMSYINGTLVIDNKVSSDYSRAHGISIEIPNQPLDSSYTEMLFAGTRWPEFIQSLQN